MSDRTIGQIKFFAKNIAGVGISMLCGAAAALIVGASGTNNGIKKGLMIIGGSVIGGMVAKNAEGYIDSQIDEMATFVTDLQSKFNDKSQEVSEGA